MSTLNGKNILVGAVNELKDVALSDSDIKDMMKEQLISNFNVIPYPEIKNYKNIDDLLGPENLCFILYMWKPNYGHWCLLQRSGDLIEFFDPYGDFPDSQLERVPEPFRTESGQSEKMLTKLLLNYDGELSYNEHKFQHSKEDIKTCGRWTLVRAILKDLPLDEFYELFKGKNSDDLVTIVTSDI